MDLFLQNKVIVVSGGARGIGEGIVRALAREGAIPVIVGRNAADNAHTLSSLQTEAWQVVAELTRPEDCRQAIAMIGDKYGRIDGLVNNAGQNDGVGLENGGYEAFMQSLHRNLVHYYLLAHYCLPLLIRSKGSIVNISSKTAETGQGGTSAYAAANGGRHALTREWAVELLKYGIRVNAVVVSECYTPLYEQWLATLADPQAQLEKIRNNIPLGKRMTMTEEIADATAFLLSERSAHTTGQWVYVDGGYVHLDRAIV